MPITRNKYPIAGCQAAISASLLKYSEELYACVSLPAMIICKKQNERTNADTRRIHP